MEFQLTSIEYNETKAAVSVELESKGVSTLLINEMFETLEDQNFEADEYESIEMRVFVKALDSSGLGLFLDNRKKSMYDYIKREIHNLVCKNSKEYKASKEKFAETFNRLILIVATAVASQLGVEASLITGVVSVLLLGVLKIGKNAWCNYYAENVLNGSGR